MKIIYIHQYFKTPLDGGSLRSYYLAKALIEKGHEVEMITSWNEGKYKLINIEGINVHYLPVHYSNSLNFFDRIYSFLKFIFKAYIVVRKIENPSLCYASSTPITVGLIAIALKKINKIPYFFEVRDLWPLAPVELGFIKNKFLIKFLFLFEKIIYKNAEKIICLSQGMKDWVNKMNVKKEIYMIPNMSDCDFFSKETISTSPFTITYFGTIGEANHLEYFVDIARYFQQDKISEVKFLIIGNGKRWKNINKTILKYSLKNIKILHGVDKYELKEILKHTHATYISFAQYDVLQTTSPNKFFDSFASGKLIISNTKGWMKDLIEENNCGFYADPIYPEEFYSKLKPYLDDINLLKFAQQNSRKLAEEKFEKKLLSDQFCNLFDREK